VIRQVTNALGLKRDGSVQKSSKLSRLSRAIILYLYFTEKLVQGFEPVHYADYAVCLAY
jgi:hypothetical protein